MAKSILPVDFLDDVLSAGMGGRRRYRKIDNEDGSISLEDVTEYDQIGSIFGQMQINAITEAVNESADKSQIIDSAADLRTNASAGMMAGALAVKEIENKLNGNITALQNLMQSFNAAKSRIISSALGAALGLTANIPLADVAAKVAAVVNRGTLNWSGSNTTFAVPAGYYPGGTLDSRPSYNNGYNAGVTAADNRANVNSVNYKAGYNAGVSAGRTLKSKTYTIASETSSSTVYDMDGASHVGWRIAVPAITDTHCIVGAHWKDSGGNQYDYYLSPDGAISNDPNTYAINIARIPGNTSDWATKTSGVIYLYVDSSKSRSHSITVYYC